MDGYSDTEAGCVYIYVCACVHASLLEHVCVHACSFTWPSWIHAHARTNKHVQTPSVNEHIICTHIYLYHVRLHVYTLYMYTNIYACLLCIYIYMDVYVCTYMQPDTGNVASRDHLLRRCVEVRVVPERESE